jgi:hypothetical protein
METKITTHLVYMIDFNFFLKTNKTNQISIKNVISKRQIHITYIYIYYVNIYAHIYTRYKFIYIFIYAYI